MKPIRKILIFILFLFFIPQVFSDQRIVLLNYNNIDESILKKFEITTKNGRKSSIINDKINKKLYLSIIDTINLEDIEIEVKYKGKVYTTVYKYNPKFKQNFDIGSEIKIKRLQKKPLSCEFAVASDILTYLLGKGISEEEVFDKVDKTYLNTLPKIKENKIFWGNPNKGFVGYIDYYGEKNKIKPTQRGMTGYGVYEYPISQIYKEYGFEIEIISKEDYNNNIDEKLHLTLLLKHLNNGNMVQLWGDWCTVNEYEDGTIDRFEINQEKVDNKINAKNYCPTTLDDRKIEWYYYEGQEIKKIEGLIGEHSFYLLGYEGGVENPTKIIVWDTDTGYHKYDTKEWIRKWNLVDNRSIIIKKN